MMIVIYAEFHKQALYAECCYAECRYAGCFRAVNTSQAYKTTVLIPAVKSFVVMAPKHLE